MSLLRDLYKKVKPLGQSLVELSQQGLNRAGGNISPIIRGIQATQMPSIRERAENYFRPTENVRTRDLVRELPNASKQVAQWIPREFILRPLAAAAGTLASPTKPDARTPRPGLEQTLLGKDEIRNLAGALKRNVPKLEEAGVPKAAAIPLAVGGFALSATPATPGSMGAKGASAIAKASKAKDVIKLLGKGASKYGDDVIENLTKAKSTKEVNRILSEAQKAPQRANLTVKPPTQAVQQPEALVRSPSVQKILGQEKPAKITRPEDVLLRDRLRAETRGANVGFKTGARETREQIATKLQAKATREALEKQITRELKSIVPKKVSGIARGKFGAETQRQLSGIREAFKLTPEQAQTRIATNLEKYADGVVPPEVIAQNEMLQMGGIKNMSNDQLVKTIENIRSLKETGMTKRALQAFNRQTDIQRDADMVIDQVTAGRGIAKGVETVGVQEPKGLAARLSAADNWLHGIDTLMVKLTKKSAKSQMDMPMVNMAKKVHVARNAQTKGMRETSDQVANAYKNSFGIRSDKELRNVIAANKEVRSLGVFKNAFGNRVDLKMSQNQAYKKWMELQDPTLRETFTRGMGWTDEMVSAVDRFLSPGTKKWAQWQLREFYPNYHQGVNEVFSNRFGTDLPFNPNYSPIKRAGLDLDQSTEGMLLQQLKDGLAGRPGALKERVGSVKPLEFVDGDETLMRHITQMEHFKAFDETISNMKAVFGNSGVRSAIKQEHGSDALSTVDDMLNKIAKDGIDSANTVVALDKLRANFTKSVLGLNPSVLLKQLASIPAYLTEMPIGAYVKGTANFWENPKANVRTLMQSEMMKARFDVGALDRDIALVMRQNQTGKMLGASDRLANWSMFTTKIGDRLAIFQGGWATYKHKYDQLIKQGVSKERANKLALEAFERVTVRTQQAGNVENLSRLQTSGGSFVKLFTMFLTASNQYYRILSRSAHGLKYGQGSKAENIKNIVIAWAVLPMLFQYVSDGFSFKKERQGRAALLGPLNGIPMLGDAFETVARVVTGDDTFGGTGAPSLFSSADKLGRAITRLKPKEGGVSLEDIFKSLGDLATVGGHLTGIPVQSPLSQLEGIKELATGETNDPRRAIFSRYALDQPSFTSKQRELISAAGTRQEKAQVRQSISDKREADKEVRSLKSSGLLDMFRGGRKETKKTDDNIVQLKDGRFRYQIGNDWKTANTEAEARLEIAKDKFQKSDKNFQEFGEWVFRKNAEGKARPQRKTDYEIGLGTAKLTNLQSKGDFKSWMSEAEKQVNRLVTEMQAPYTDEQEYLAYENRLITLMGNIEKFNEYGGFKKPKSGSSARISRPASFSSRPKISRPASSRGGIKISPVRRRTTATQLAQAPTAQSRRGVVRPPRLARPRIQGSRV